MRKIFFSALILFFSLVHSYAQDTAYSNGVQVHYGKTFSDSEVSQMNRQQEAANFSPIGKRYRSFDLADQYGKRISSASSLGKVSLLVFWEPTDNSHLRELKELWSQFGSDPHFQMVLVTFDTSALKKTFEDYQPPFSCAMVRSVWDVHEMNYRNGLPSYVVLNKNLVVSLVYAKHIGGPDDKMNELKTVVKNLLMHG